MGVRISQNVMDWIAELRREGLMISEIAEAVGIGHSAVAYRLDALRKAGVNVDVPDEIRRQRNRENGRKRVVWTDDMIDRLRQCARAGMTRREAAESLGLRYEQVSRFASDLDGVTFVKAEPEAPGNFHRVPATHSAAWIGCRVSVAADTGDEARRLCEAVVASAAMFRKQRRVAA